MKVLLMETASRPYSTRGEKRLNQKFACVLRGTESGFDGGGWALGSIKETRLLFEHRTSLDVRGTGGTWGGRNPSSSHAKHRPPPQR